MTRSRRLIAALLVAFTVALVSAAPASAESIRAQQWHLDFLHIAQAHKISKGAGVIVATTDTGVDASHPDLKGSVLPGTDLTGSRLAGSLKDGREDSHGHGTGVAGIIVAHGQALGIAPEAKILPVRNTLDIFAGDVAASVDWAVDHGATVICIAQGDNDRPALREAIANAFAKDVVVVAAAGNKPYDMTMGYPAMYPGVVNVAGVDRKGNHPDFSLTGPQVLLSAPAVDIVSTGLKHGYTIGTGTSAATAIVAGVAALIRSKYPDLPATEVIRRMVLTADDRGTTGHDDQYGYGIIDPVAALTADIPPATPTTSPSPQTTAAPSTPPLGLDWRLIAEVGAILLVLLLTAAAVTTAAVRARRP